MEQICNLVYYRLTKDKSPAERAELDMLLSDPKEKEEMRDRQNAEAMKQLMSMPGMITPPGGPRVPPNMPQPRRSDF